MQAFPGQKLLPCNDTSAYVVKQIHSEIKVDPFKQVTFVLLCHCPSSSDITLGNFELFCISLSALVSISWQKSPSTFEKNVLATLQGTFRPEYQYLHLQSYVTWLKIITRNDSGYCSSKPTQYQKGWINSYNVILISICLTK